MFLNLNETKPIEETLRIADLLTDDESVVSLTIPGAGNMNFTVRATTSLGNSFIVKQARDYVEKYPSIPAPPERAMVEASFYKSVQTDEFLSTITPRLLYTDQANSMLVIEDLGVSADFTFLYRRNQQIEESALRDLVQFLTSLHLAFPKSATRDSPSNMAMRLLNAEHIFRFPFSNNNGLDLDQITPGLQTAADEYRSDERVLSAAQDLRTVYLADGDTLIHGDYYPGSWLQTGDGPRVIDPEFSFVGPQEFDLAVMVAHLLIARQSRPMVEAAKSLYQPIDMLDMELFDKFVGIEIYRRLIGLAQLPGELDLAEKQELLSLAHRLLV